MVRRAGLAAERRPYRGPQQRGRPDIRGWHLPAGDFLRGPHRSRHVRVGGGVEGDDDVQDVADPGAEVGALEEYVGDLDLVGPEALGQHLLAIQALGEETGTEWAEIVPVSATSGHQVGLLTDLLVARSASESGTSRVR